MEHGAGRSPRAVTENTPGCELISVGVRVARAPRHPGVHSIANVTSTEAKKPAPVMNVQAVWFGERPYVITTEGNRYYKGAFLDNGWMIKDIVDGRILLAKDGETLALVYRQ